MSATPPRVINVPTVPVLTRETVVKIIRVEIEVDDCVHCPDGAEELSDLLYGIGDGMLAGRITITASPVVPKEPSYVVPTAPGAAL